METSLLNFELQYFLQIAKSKTFLAAADSLGISQPALSRAMDRLEEKLGFKVFRRSRNGIEITDQGAELLVRVKAMNESMDLMLKEIKHQSSEPTGEFRIGGHESILQDFLLPVYPKLASEFPHVRFHLESKPSREVVQCLMNRKMELGLVINPVEYSQLLIRPLAPARSFFYSEIKNPQKFFLNPQMIDLNKLLRVLKKKLLDENSLHFVDTYDLIATLVKDKMGSGLLPEHVARRYGLKLDEDTSAHFKVNYELKLVVSSEMMDEKKKSILRFLEKTIKSNL